MELLLTAQTNDQIVVICDGAHSHTFDLRTLLPGMQHGASVVPQPLDAPQAYGELLYSALFPPNSVATQGLRAAPQRIVLITEDATLQAIPWEYAHGPHDFLVLDTPFVRGLPAAQSSDLPLLDQPLHIVAVPSNPLDSDVPALDIEGEWQRLLEVVLAVPYAITLERTRPPTLAQLRNLVANQRQRVVHFMGHGGLAEGEVVLLFEAEDGAPKPIAARDFVRRVRAAAFLVTLNACISATPGATLFSNLAARLVQEGVPYALGMRFSIRDDDARTFSRALYSELARGSPVEEAVQQARLALADNGRAWAVGVPVLYTSLRTAAKGFAPAAGMAQIHDPRPPINVFALPETEGGLRGRHAELRAIAAALTGDTRPRLFTIHGGGGQGKTALARAAVERISYAWPGGVWAVSLETLPSRASFVVALATFLGIPTGELADPTQLERQVLTRLGQRRTLIVLDNAETLVEGVEANDTAALALAQWLREQLPGPLTTLLVTSRVMLGWAGEEGLSLGGLTPVEGAQLFRQSAPQRQAEVELALALALSRQVDGHPLSLRLLAGAFNDIARPLDAFVQEYAAELVRAKDRYKDASHRHRSLYASIETSVRYLNAGLRDLLSGLWIFHAWFLPESAEAIFAGLENGQGDKETGRQGDSPTMGEEGGSEAPTIADQLHTLWRRGLLVCQTRTLRDGDVVLYRLLPSMRIYVEQALPHAYVRDTLLARFGAAYAGLAWVIYDELDRSARLIHIAQQAREDLARGLVYVDGELRGYYQLLWGGVLQRLGTPVEALRLNEQTLEFAQGQDPRLALAAMNNMALAYSATGQPQRALVLYEQALPLMREVGDRAGEAKTLNNMAVVYDETGQPQRALALYKQALSIRREIGDRTGEAATLNNMALMYHMTGQPQRALPLLEQALPLMREVGDRAGEASTLSSMAAVYSATGQPQRALVLYEQALPLMREVGDRAGEASTLSNMAEVYRVIGQPQRALPLLEQALPIRQEVGDRAGEAATLNNISYIYFQRGEPERTVETLRRVVQINHEIGAVRAEAAVLFNLAVVLQLAFGQTSEAISLVTRSVELLTQHNLPQDASGKTIAQHQEFLAELREGVAAPTATPAVIPAQQLEIIVNNTIAVLTDMPEKRDELRTMIIETLAQVQQQEDDWPGAVEFLHAVVELLDGNQASLPAGHPYAEALAAILAGVGLPDQPTVGPPDTRPLPADFVARCVAGLRGAPADKVALFNDLEAIVVAYPGFQALIQVVQDALFGADLVTLGAELVGEEAALWHQIVAGVTDTDQ